MQCRIKGYFNPFNVWNIYRIFWGDTVQGKQDTSFECIIEMMDMVNEIDDECWNDFANNPYGYFMDWHVGRVKYFVEHPEMIDAIEITEDIVNGEIHDGNHRYVASIILNLKQIPCWYEGEDSFFYDVLKGISIE